MCVCVCVGSFTDDTLDQALKERVVLTNPGNGPASFSWDVTEDEGRLFSISPRRGVVKAGDSFTCEVQFKAPSHGGLVSAHFCLKVEDGHDQLSADIHNCTCVCVCASVDDLSDVHVGSS